MFRVRRFGVVRTATLAAVMYALITLFIVVPIGLLLMASGPTQFTDSLGRTTVIEFSPIFFVLLPLIYGVLGWIFTALFCLVYNLAAGITGGVEITLVAQGGTPTPTSYQAPIAPQAPPQAPLPPQAPPAPWSDAPPQS